MATVKRLFVTLAVNLCCLMLVTSAPAVPGYGASNVSFTFNVQTLNLELNIPAYVPVNDAGSSASQSGSSGDQTGSSNNETLSENKEETRDTSDIEDKINAMSSKLDELTEYINSTNERTAYAILDHENRMEDKVDELQKELQSVSDLIEANQNYTESQQVVLIRDHERRMVEGATHMVRAELAHVTEMLTENYNMTHFQGFPNVRNHLYRLSDTVSHLAISLRNVSSQVTVTKRVPRMNSAFSGVDSKLEELEESLNVMNTLLADQRGQVNESNERLDYLRDDLNATLRRLQEAVGDVSASIRCGLQGVCMNPGGTYPRDCEEVYKVGGIASGVYKIQPEGAARHTNAFCEMGTRKWTTVMQRFNGSVDFRRNWTDFMWGFGDPAREHWIGLEYMHRLTHQGRYMLRVDMTEWVSGLKKYATFKVFSIGSEARNFRLNITRDAGDADRERLSHANGVAFSTRDKDNDASRERNCAEQEQGAWWHRDCSNALLTGPYREDCSDDICMTWSYKVSLRKVHMKIARIK